MILMDKSSLELTPEEMSEIIQRDVKKWAACNHEFVMDVAAVIAKAQFLKVCSLLEPVELEALEPQQISLALSQAGHTDEVCAEHEIISQATIRYNQSHGQLYKEKETKDGH